MGESGYKRLSKIYQRTIRRQGRNVSYFNCSPDRTRYTEKFRGIVVPPWYQVPVKYLVWSDLDAYQGNNILTTCCKFVL
jgi:hypothetical protein